MSHLSISGNKGFQLKFSNGFTVSVQFGPYNYCANGNLPPQAWGMDRATTPVPKSPNAEVAVFHPNGEFLPMAGVGDTVRGWVTPDDVARLISWAASQPADAPTGLVVPASVFVDGEK